MINYSAIADRAVAILGVADDTRYEEAYTVMKTETVAVPLDTAMHTPLSLAKHLGFGTGKSVYDKLCLLGGKYMEIILNSPQGIDLKDPESQAMLAAWHDNTDPTKLSDAEYNGLMTLIADRAELRWPGLEPGHVQNALQWRVEGRV